MSNIPRVMIAAPKSGSGKTLITCAIISALKLKGLNVSSVKSGPDYIDPMFHRTVLGVPATNLDTFFSDTKDCLGILEDSSKNSDICVFEGVMGLFDGIGGIRDEGSSYDLAHKCQVPIILVVDAKGQARSVVPVIQGFLSYDKHKLIKGVILNNMSGMLFTQMKSLLEKEVPVPILGYFERNEKLRLESRHLGLVMPDEISDIQTRLSQAGDALCKTVDVNSVINISKKAESLPKESFLEEIEPVVSNDDNSPVIAVARDEAFCFYYDINIRIIEKLGAKIEYFSPLNDTSLPENTAGILLGGGYPELFAKELSENIKMLSVIRKAIEESIPTVAECGGFMYLHKALIDKDGNSFPLVGVIDAAASFKGKLIRFGYTNITETKGYFISPQDAIKGHEFHYYDSTRNGEDCIAQKPYSNRSWECNFVSNNHWWGFSHLYYPSNLDFPRSFIRKMQNRNQEKAL